MSKNTDIGTGETWDKVCSGYCATDISHNAPGYYQLHNGQNTNYIQGDVLESVEFFVYDQTAGTSYSVTVNPFGYPQQTVTGLTVTSPTSGDVTVLWQDFAGATQYVIERKGPGTGFTQVGVEPEVYGTTVQSWADTSTAYQTKYTYRVWAFYNNTSIGRPSFPVYVVPAAPNRLKHYVVLGDSYAAGVGASGTASGNDQCQRSPNTSGGLLGDAQDTKTVRQYAALHQARLDIIACNGAVLDNMIPEFTSLLPSTLGIVQPNMEGYDAKAVLGDPYGDRISADFQVKMLAEAARRDPVDYVTVSIGGNDAGFSHVLQDCVLNNNGCDSSGQSLVNYEAMVRQRIDNLSPKLVEVYKDIITASRSPLLDVIGYPYILPANSPCSLPLVGPYHRTLSADQDAMLHRLTDELDSVISNAVSFVAQDTYGIGFIDTRPTFAGHDMCSSSPYIHTVMTEFVWAWPPIKAAVKSAHPNDDGWAAEAALIHNTRWWSTG